MSPSTRSKPASASSPEPGDAPEAGEAAADDEAADEASEDPKRAGAPLEITLESARQRSAGSAAFGLILGGLLVWKLGTVGVWVGVILLVLGSFRLWEVVQSFLYPPGTIVVGDERVVLPLGLCMPRPVELPASAVTAAYFLRRSVPWNRSAPVLIVEAGGRAMAFPRDWFASESDQRRVIHALLRGIDDVDGDAPARTATPPDRMAWLAMIGGLAMMVVGLVGTLLGPGGGIGAVFVAPLVAGAIIGWRGFARW